ncbi:MAG: hypothetical protein RMX65_032575 [Nostoc sp. DedQUE01]|nr:hypothetical protein [Nostoc sp. DedQUE01]
MWYWKKSAIAIFIPSFPSFVDIAPSLPYFEVERSPSTASFIVLGDR